MAAMSMGRVMVRALGEILRSIGMSGMPTVRMLCLCALLERLHPMFVVLFQLPESLLGGLSSNIWMQHLDLAEVGCPNLSLVGAGWQVQLPE